MYTTKAVRRTHHHVVPAIVVGAVEGFVLASAMFC